MTTPTIDHPRVVSPAEWAAARQALLIKEKDWVWHHDRYDDEGCVDHRVQTIAARPAQAQCARETGPP